MNADIFALLLKVSVILAVAALVVVLLRGSSAARRHFAWFASLASIVMLVFLQLVVPPIVVPVAPHSPLAAIAHSAADDLTPSGILASRTAPRAASAALETSREVDLVSLPEQTERNDRRAHQSVKSPLLSALDAHSQSADQAPRTSIATSSTTAGAASHVTPREFSRTIAQATTQAPSQATPFSRDQLRQFLLSVWLTGTLFALMRLVLAHWQLRRIARTARLITGTAQNAQIDAIAARLDFHQPVQLLTHARITTPCTAGWWKPIILLPGTFTKWSDARQQAVFTHELAHIARGDSLAQAVASVACALFWFHPACWMASRQLRGESERAADDCVINSGMTPVDYAAHLLAIAQVSSLGARVPNVALGMARTSQLELRLRAMLNVRQSRRVLTRGAQRALGSVALMAIVPFAGLQARVQEPRTQPPRTPPVAAPAATAQPLVAQPPVAQPPKRRSPVASPSPVQPPVSQSPGVPASVARPASIPRAAVAAPPPSREVGAPALPSQSVRTPPLPSQSVAAPAMPSQSVRTPPLPSQSVAAPAMPSQSVRTPPLPSQSVAAPALPAQDVAVPALPVPGAAPRALPMPGVAVPPLPSAPGRRVPIAPPAGASPPKRLTAADTTFERMFEAVSVDSLYVNIPAGGNVTVHGWDSNTAKVRASLGGKYWRETKVLLYRGQSRLVLFAAPEIDGAKVIEPRPGVIPEVILARRRNTDEPSVAYVPSTVDNEFELWVPRKMHVEFRSPIGALTIRDMDGGFGGSTRFGALDVSNSRGNSSLSTDNGDIFVVASQLSGFMHTKCGALSIANTGNDLTATTGFDAGRNPLIVVDGVVVPQPCIIKRF